jgi:FtsZ-interacting cell division protein YlmF
MGSQTQPLSPPLPTFYPLPKPQLPSPGLSEVVIFEIKKFDEVTRVLEELKGKKLVVINLQCEKLTDSQRVIDVISGGVCLMNGSLERVSEKIFLFTPEFINIIGSSNISEDYQHNTNAKEDPQIWRQAS